MIRINGIEWRVLMVSPTHPYLQRSDGVAVLGCCDSESLAIYIDDTLNNFYLKKVLCHELTHAAMFSYQIDLSYEQEEVVADLIATYGQEIIHMTNVIFKRLIEQRKAESQD